MVKAVEIRNQRLECHSVARKAPYSPLIIIYQMQGETYPVLRSMIQSPPN